MNHRVWVVEGSDVKRIEPYNRGANPDLLAIAPQPTGETLPTTVETWLLAPVPAPDFSLPDLSGRMRTLSEFKGKQILLVFWTARSQDSLTQLVTFEKNCSRWLSKGLQTLPINLDNLRSGPSTENQIDVDALLAGQHFSFPILRGSADTAAVYNILYRQLFDRHRDLSLPTSFLIDENGWIVKVYQGAINPDQITQDFSRIPRTEAQRLARALPFPTSNFTLAFGRNHLSTGALFFQRGYLEQAEVSFQMAVRDDPASAEALYGIGAVYLNQNKNAPAREMFERCVKLQPAYPDTLPDAWNNLGVLATRENRIDDAIRNFQQALSINPRHLLSLDNLGNAYRLQKRWDDARTILVRAIEVAPDDAEANYGLGMVYAQTNQTEKAYEYLRGALKSRPAYPEALNNLGILYLVTNRLDDAVASFENCIQVVPEFDQAYLNLARVYALEGAKDKAREVLLALLQQHPNHPQAEQMLQQLQQ